MVMASAVTRASAAARCTAFKRRKVQPAADVQQTASSALTQKTFDFLALPGEMRNNIYRLLVVPRSKSQTIYTDFCHCAKTWEAGAWACPDLSILRVNRQIHEEASSLLFKEVGLCCHIYGQEVDDSKPPQKWCKLCGCPKIACLTTLPLDAVARFDKVSITVDFDKGFPLRDEYFRLQSFLSKFAAVLQDERKKIGRPCKLYMIWGDYDNIKVDMGDDHDRTTQRVYHYRRLSAILEPLDWLFTDIKDVEYSANRWFEVDGQDMFEFNDKNKDTYIALGWGKWWKNPGIVDESADFLDGSSTNTSFAEFRDAEDEALMQGDLTMEELMAEEAYAEELYENGMEAYEAG